MHSSTDGYFKPIDPVVRFMEKVSPEPMSGCWIWTGALLDAGYGQFNYNGRVLKAHRVSLMMFRGVAPGPWFALHKCDVRCCVNPDHLMVGDHAENMRQMKERGRANGGCPRDLWKFTSADVVHAQEMKMLGFNHNTIAKCVRVSRNHLHCLLRANPAAYPQEI